MTAGVFIRLVRSPSPRFPVSELMSCERPKRDWLLRRTFHAKVPVNVDQPTLLDSISRWLFVKLLAEVLVLPTSGPVKATEVESVAMKE